MHSSFFPEMTVAVGFYCGDGYITNKTVSRYHIGNSFFLRYDWFVDCKVISSFSDLQQNILLIWSEMLFHKVLNF